ncbi:hypothetical protein [Methylocystis sp. JR02]|nr:hypothetical protein [Methylocystis sp. JR02]MDJ0448841.1 hypothetical protein [Methylocystis sp. JR02]
MTRLLILRGLDRHQSKSLIQDECFFLSVLTQIDVGFNFGAG